MVRLSWVFPQFHSATRLVLVLVLLTAVDLNTPGGPDGIDAVDEDVMDPQSLSSSDRSDQSAVEALLR